MCIGIFGEIVYSLVGKHSNEFHIEPESGIITVLNSTFLDRERENLISLTAVATDKAPMTTRKSTAVSVSTYFYKNVNFNVANCFINYKYMLYGLYNIYVRTYV